MIIRVPFGYFYHDLQLGSTRYHSVIRVGDMSQHMLFTINQSTNEMWIDTLILDDTPAICEFLSAVIVKGTEIVVRNQAATLVGLLMRASDFGAVIPKDVVFRYTTNVNNERKLSTTMHINGLVSIEKYIKANGTQVGAYLTLLR